MKVWQLFCLCLFVAALALPLGAEEQEVVHRWEEHVSDVYWQDDQDFTDDYLDEIDEYLAVMDDEAAVFLELNISNDLLEDDLQPKNLSEIIHARTQDLPREADGISWKWDLTNIPPSYDYGQIGTAEQDLIFTKRFDVASVGKKENQETYVAATELSRALANVQIYTEFGITGGRIDGFEEPGLSAEEIEEAIALDLSGYYVTGGANLGLGRWTLGVEAGYGSGDATSNSSKQPKFSGLSDSSEFIGQVQAENSASGSAPQNPQSSAVTSFSEDPFKLFYFQGTADRNVTNKLGVKLGAICFAVPEQFVADFAGKDVRDYGFELFGDINYQFAKSIKYSLYMDYALTDERFEEENIYQILNRVEFNF
jgi:hypothetical protein